MTPPTPDMCLRRDAILMGKYLVLTLSHAPELSFFLPIIKQLSFSQLCATNLGDAKATLAELFASLDQVPNSETFSHWALGEFTLNAHLHNQNGDYQEVFVDRCADYGDSAENNEVDIRIGYEDEFGMVLSDPLELSVEFIGYNNYCHD